MEPKREAAIDWLRELGTLSGEGDSASLTDDGSAETAPEIGGGLPGSDVVLKADATPAKPSQPAARKGGKPGKAGNLTFEKGGYWISLPPDTDGEFPLIVMFGGDTGRDVMVDAARTREDMLKAVIFVIGANSGSYGGARGALDPLLGDKTKVGKISVCGYSSGGQAAYRDYGKATKAVGLIDPTTYYKDLKVLDGKAVLVCNPKIWKYWKSGLFLAGHPDKAKKNTYTVEDAQKEAVAIVQGKGGTGSIEDIDHGKYPVHFMKNYGSNLY